MDLLAPKEIVWQETKDSMSPNQPIVDCDLDPKAAELLVVTVPHSNILYVKNNQWGSTHGSNCILFITLLLLRWSHNVLPAKIYRNLGEIGYNIVFGTKGFLVALIAIFSSSFRPASIALLRLLLLVMRLSWWRILRLVWRRNAGLGGV
jgi:hypothetical protein